MRNLQFGYGYLTEGATGYATATASGYDPSNAVALGRDTSWKGVGTGAQRLYLQTPSAITPTFLGIAGANWSGFGTTPKLQHSTDGVTWTDFLTLTGHTTLADDDEDYRADFSALSPVAKSWWSLYWPAPTVVPHVANFYLGYYATLSKNDSYGGAEVDVYNVDRQRSEGAIIQAEQTARRLLRVDMAWKKIDSTLRDTIRGILRGEDGPLRPFWFVPIDESGSSLVGRSYLMRYEPLITSVRRNFLNSYELGFSLLEEV